MQSLQLNGLMVKNDSTKSTLTLESIILFYVYKNFMELSLDIIRFIIKCFSYMCYYI